MSKANKVSKHSFQNLILSLQQYWADQGCVILQPYDMEMGAGTFHPATVCARLGRSPGMRLMCNPRADQPTGAMAKTPIAFSIITSFR